MITALHSTSPAAATLAAWLHDLDPFALRITETFGLRWYGLSYIVGFALGYLLARRVAAAGKSPLTPQRVGDMVIFLAIGIVLGGRLGYVFFYRIDLLWTFYSDLPFWGVLAVNEGGMASHGGMIGGIGATWLFARRNHLPWAHLLDVTAFGAPLGLLFGRIANFINGELVGRPCSESYPLAVKFPQDLLEADWTSADGGVTLAELVRHVEQAKGVVFDSVQQGVYFTIDRIQQGDAAVAQVVKPLLQPRHPSQLYAAAMEGLIVFIVLLIAWRRPRKPGVIGGLFCVVYALMRIGNEFFRMPDAHLMNQEFAVTSITRGQWLSVGLLILGGVVIYFARRRDVEPLGGWRRVGD